jgi:hypothetical protein
MELTDLRFWNQAPTNLKVLTDNGIVFALTTDKLKKIEDFRTNLLKAIKYGFDKKSIRSINDSTCIKRHTKNAQRHRQLSCHGRAMLTG